MSLELSAVELGAIKALWQSWSASDVKEVEIEAAFRGVNYTGFLAVVKYLRILGLREEPQAPKLNIMVSGGLRFTLVGEGVIQAYCRDNTLKGKPFHVVLKEKQATRNGEGPSDVDLNEYDVRIKIRKELALSKEYPRVVEALRNWGSLPKSFRYIKRYSFTSTQHSGIRFDLSVVRQNRRDGRGQYLQSTTFNGANITTQPIGYEIEVEAFEGAELKSMLAGIATSLRGLQQCYAFTRRSVREMAVAQMMGLTGAKSKFPGTQPVTLQKVNFGVEESAGAPNIRKGDYNVTDKADGLRCLMLVAKTGRIYLIDRNMRVYGTDRRMDEVGTTEWAGAVLDGEWVTQDADGAQISRYYAFDIYNSKRGEDVSERPFIVRTSAAVAVSRLAAMTETVGALNGAGLLFAGIPKQHSLTIHMKNFQIPEDPTNSIGIFDAAKSVLDRVATTRPYHSDGLIFTPNASPLPKNVDKWPSQFKWKPASENSVDFLVEVDKERGADGRSTGVERVSTKLREDTNQIVRYKTLRLLVGSSKDPALLDPRETILHKKPIPAMMESRGGAYRPVEFSPTPPDPMSSVCHVAINAGATDAAGAAPGAAILASLDDAIYCDSTRDPIANRTIVEMVYKPKNPAGWRWVPMRVRWDKTEQFQRGEILGTLNGSGTANDVWLSIHDPITEHMIRTGSINEDVGEEGRAVSAVAYYQRKASQRDQHKVRGLADFHNAYIKSQMLLGRTLGPKAALLDMSVGQAGDIHKWIDRGVGWVLGCDLALTGLVEPENGAYARYLKRMIQARGAIPKMIFVQANSAMRYADGAAGQTPLDRSILRTLWGENEPTAPPAAAELRGAATLGFDVVSLMFSLHYFCKDRSTFDGLMRNISDTLKVGGYFIGCCFDGATVAAFLKDIPLGGVKRGNEDGVDIWTITKKYDDGTGALPGTEEGLGRAIDVNYISIGQNITEYLVSWEYVQSRFATIGLDLLNPDELATMGLNNSTNMFSTSYDMAAAGGRTFPMSPAVKSFSFLNRWFIFRRRSTGSVGATAAETIVESVRPGPTLRMAAENSPPEFDVAAAVAAAEESVAAEAAANVATEANAAAAAEAAEAGEEGEAGEAEDTEEADAGAGTAVAEERALIKASGPIYQFYHKSAPKDELKVGNKHWRRALSTYAPFEFKDPKNPEIVYPSLEAALGSAKYQLASNKPELGPQIFSEAGNIHQEFAIKRIGDGGAPRDLKPEEAMAIAEEEGNKMRAAQKPTEMKKAGAKFDPAAWEEVRERGLTEYVRQRYERDPEFKKILDALAEQKAHLAYYVAGSGNELGASVKGDEIEGDNLYGRALMYQVGLRY